VQRPEAERPDRDPEQPLLRKRPLETERWSAVSLGSLREEQRDPLVTKAAHGEFDERRRRGVEPLDVVDRDQDVGFPRERAQSAEKAQ
jgi:hypothetical protein